jgi:hypothetical protein
MAIIRGLSSLSGNASSALTAAAASTRSSSIFSSAFRSFTRFPQNITEFTFAPIEAAILSNIPLGNFIGTILSGDEVRTTLLDAPHNNSIAGSDRNPNYEDSNLIDFLKGDQGSNFLKLQNIRKPVHILADFDYATLNMSLDPDAVPDEESRNRSSGAARIWCRNENAREWREWVAGCLFADMAIGPEHAGSIATSTPDAISAMHRLINPDQMTISIAGPGPGMIYDTTRQSYKSLENSIVVSNLKQGYANIYLAEHFLKSVFSHTPFHEKGALNLSYNNIHDKGDSLAENVGPMGDDDLLKQFNDEFSAKNEFYKNFGIAKGFSYKSFASQQRDFTHFALDFPQTEQGYIKSVIESSRHIGTFLKDEKFSYRSDDDLYDDTTAINAQRLGSFDVYRGDIQEIKIYHGSNVYVKAHKIRRMFLNSYFLKNNPQKRVYLKGLKSEEGKSVIDLQDQSSQDDIEKLMSRKLRIDERNSIVISPYLTSDHLIKKDEKVIHFLSLKDSMDFKKSTLLNLVDFRISNPNAAFPVDDLTRMNKFTFDYGPDQLKNFMSSLKLQLCPINSESNYNAKNALLLLDHRNVVAHLTHGLVGQFITNAALEKVSVIDHTDIASLATYEIKISNSGTFASTAEFDLTGEYSGDLVANNVINPNTDEITGKIFNKFTGGSENSVSKELSCLLNSTFVQYVSPAKRKEFIFWCILLQISDYDTSGNSMRTPYFMQFDADNPDRVNTEKFPRIADALYSQFKENLQDEITGRFPNIRDFFDAAQVTLRDNDTFSSIDLETKSRVNSFLVEDMKSECFNSGDGPTHGIFDNIKDQQRRVNTLPGLIDSARNQYREILNDVASRLTAAGASSNSNHQRAAAVKSFLQSNPAATRDKWSLVIGDFLTNGAENNQAEILFDDDDSRLHEYGRKSARQSQIRYNAQGDPIFETRFGEVIGITGIAAGYNRTTNGFASMLMETDENPVANSFKDSALKGIRDKVLNFDRRDNILISLAENICAILFYGFPDDSSENMFEQQFKSSFQKNEIGILNYLGLLDSGHLHMTQKEIFEVVWEYCTIADSLISSLPNVEMKFEFSKSVYREDMWQDGVYTESPDLLGPLDASYLNGFNAASREVFATINQYLPPNSGGKGSGGSPHADYTTFGATTLEESQQRKRELTEDLSDLAARAAVFFSKADMEVSREPQFKLKFSRKTVDGRAPDFTILAKAMKLGFLPHLSIDSDFSRFATKFQENHVSGDVDLLSGQHPSTSTGKAAVARYVGLREKSSSTGEIHSLKIISTETLSHYDSLIPKEDDRGRIKHYAQETQSSLQAQNSQRPRSPFKSLEILPRSCFGFVYNLGINQHNNTRFDDKYFDSNFRVEMEDHQLTNLNQFPDGPEREKIKKDLLISTDTGFENLNKFYEQRLGTTPPKIYSKLVKRFPAVNKLISQHKRNHSSSTDEAIDALHEASKSNPAFVLHTLHPPREAKIKKVTLEITVCKTSYQFMKAYKAAHTDVNTGQINGVIPADKSGLGSTNGSYNDLISIIATFFKGNTVPTKAENPGIIRLRPYSGYRDNTTTVELNDLGNHMRNSIHGPIPVPQTDASHHPAKLAWNWQFDVLCKVMSEYSSMSNHDYRVYSPGTTTNAPVDLHSIRSGIRPEDISDLAGAYVWNKGSGRGYSQDIQDWLEDWASPRDRTAGHPHEWSNYYFYRAQTSTSAGAYYRANMDHRISDSSPINADRSSWPNSPQKAILGSLKSGTTYSYIPDNPDDRIIQDTALGIPIIPEFFHANKHKTIKSDEKIKIEVYLASNDGGSTYTHYSTERIESHQHEHPSARPIDTLLGVHTDALAYIFLRPDVVTGLQYKFNRLDPKYLGPIIRDTSELSFEGYFANEQLPFLPSFDWGKHLHDALTNVPVASHSDSAWRHPTTPITTENFLGITLPDLSLHFREICEQMAVAEIPAALGFLNSVRYSIERYITLHDEDMDSNQKAWLRTIPHNIPYFYDWRIQYPSLELDMSFQTTTVRDEYDILADINWGYIKGHSDDFSNPGSNFTQEPVMDIYHLENQYLDFVSLQEKYADTCAKAFPATMTAMTKNIDKFLSTPSGVSDLASNKQPPVYSPYSSFRDSNSTSIVGKASSANISREIKEFITNNGFLGVTPDTISSLDCIYRLYKEQYGTLTSGFDYQTFSANHKGRGLRISNDMTIQVPFKLSPYDIQTPHQIRGQLAVQQTHPIQKWKVYERGFADPEVYGAAALDSNFTRVCFIGIESGELQKILDAPLETYNDRADSLDTDKLENFQVKLELFDFFRPWLKFEYIEPIYFSRQKPWRIYSPSLHGNALMSDYDYLSKNHMISPTVKNLLTDGLISPVKHGQTARGAGPSFGGNDQEDKYNKMDIFLKAYASKVLGLDFFSFMIPRRGTTPPISDYSLDSSSGEGLLPEERNYQEYLNEYTKILFDQIKVAQESKNLSSVGHILKYFFERKTTIDQSSTIIHQDGFGRSSLIAGESGFGLFSPDVVSDVDGDFPKFFPYKFSKPITETSLAAAEILTAVNEYSSNIMKEFRNGFMFDRIVGIPYKLSNFEISQEIRTELSGESIDLSTLERENYVRNNNGTITLTGDYFKQLLASLPYLDTTEDNEGKVTTSALYPLTLRASICRKGEE